VSAIIKIFHEAIEVTEQLHWYGLNVDLTPDLGHNGFRLEILWPFHIPITSNQNFEEGDEQDVLGTRYIPLMLYSDQKFLSGQNLRIIGPESNAILVYEIDKGIARLIKATSLKLYYKLYLPENLPVEGEIPFDTLNDFLIS